MKKWLFPIIIICTFLLIPTLTIAQDFTCTMRLNNTCIIGAGEVPVLNVRNDTGGYDNAHAQLQSNGTYPYTLCCKSNDLTIPLTTSESTGYIPILRLSNTTNAHIQNSSYTDWTNIIYLSANGEDIRCETQTPQCQVGYSCILQLSSDSNAHISSCQTGKFTTKLCCYIQPSGSGGTGGPPSGGITPPPLDLIEEVNVTVPLLNQTQMQETLNQTLTYITKLGKTSLDFLHEITWYTWLIIAIIFALIIRALKKRKIPIIQDKENG